MCVGGGTGGRWRGIKPGRAPRRPPEGGGMLPGWPPWGPTRGAPGGPPEGPPGGTPRCPPGGAPRGPPGGKPTWLTKDENQSIALI